MEYKYHLCGIRYGGEHTIGTIPLETAKYWFEQGASDLTYYASAFEEYIYAMDWQEETKDKWNAQTPVEFQINDYWHDIDNLYHQCSVEFADGNILEVKDITDVEPFSMAMSDAPIVAEINMTEELVGFCDTPIMNNIIDISSGNKCGIVYGQSFEKGSFYFDDLITNKPFDASLLKFNLSEWDAIRIVDSISYDGQVLYAQGGDTMSKSQTVWIEVPDFVKSNTLKTADMMLGNNVVYH